MGEKFFCSDDNHKYFYFYFSERNRFIESIFQSDRNRKRSIKNFFFLNKIKNIISRHKTKFKKQQFTR